MTDGRPSGRGPSSDRPASDRPAGDRSTDERSGDGTTTAVVFDLDGTLVEFTREWIDLLVDVVTDHVGRADESLLAAYDEAFFERFAAARPRPYHAAAAALFEAADVDGDPDAFVAALRETEYDHLAVVDGARPLLDALAGRPLGVLTNGVRDWQVGKLERVGLRDRFDAVVTSYDAGATKPDPAPFALLEERLPADEYVMIGDDREADVLGARERGWRAVHLDGETTGLAAGSPGELAAFIEALV